MLLYDSYKASCARLSYAAICNFWHLGKRQSAWISKITNDGLTRSDIQDAL